MSNGNDDIIAQVVEDLQTGAKRVGQGFVDTARQVDALFRLVTAENLAKIARELGPVGDAKALGIDAPRDFAEGRNVMGVIDILSAAPGIFGLGGDALRMIGRILQRGGGKALDLASDAVRASPTLSAADRVIPGRSVADIDEAVDAREVANIRGQIRREQDIRDFTGVEGPISATDELAFLQNRQTELKGAIEAADPGQTRGLIDQISQVNRDITTATQRQVAEVGFTAPQGIAKGNPIDELEFDDALKSLGELINRRLGN